jgi:hypothetical protein
MKMMVVMTMMTTTPRGWQLALDRVQQGLPQTDVSSSRAEASKGPQGEGHDECQKEVSPRHSCADTPPATIHGLAALPP